MADRQANSGAITPVWIIESVHECAALPQRAHPGDAGYDLYTCLDTICTSNVSTIRLDLGLRIQPPEGWWFEITGRSSTRHRYGLSVRRSIIDSGYRGDLYIMADVVGRGVDPWCPPGGVGDDANASMIPAGTRLAQLIAHRLEPIIWSVGQVDQTERGTGGFGSSGQ